MSSLDVLIAKFLNDNNGNSDEDGDSGVVENAGGFTREMFKADVTNVK